MKNTFNHPLFITLLFSLVGIIIYSNSFGVPFYFDDSDNIQNPVIRIDNVSLDTFSDIFSSSLLKTRPISNLSFALNHYFCAERVQSYHLVNIIIHITTAIILFFLFSTIISLLPASIPQNHRFHISFFSSFLWLTHPLATQSVTYIVQRMNSMAAMFYVLSIFLYVRGRLVQKEVTGSPYQQLIYYYIFLLSLVSGLLALGSKEVAATLPIAIFTFEWYFFQDLQISWIRKKIFVLIITIVGFVSLALIYTNGNLADAILNGYKFRDFSLTQRLITELRVIVHYLGLLIYPNPDSLHLDYSYPLSKSLTQPISTLISGILLFLIAVTGCILAKKERLISFCIFWFFLNLLIESSFIPLEIIYEHRTYLPSMFLIFLFVLSVYRFFNYPKTISTLLLLLSVQFCYWTIQRNADWLDPIAFWNKSLNKFPDNARIHINVGVEYISTGDLSEAERHFQEALRLQPSNALALNNLASIRKRSGNYYEAEILLRKTIAISPDHVLARMNLASILKIQGRYNESLEQSKIVHNLYPDYSKPNIEIGQLVLQANKPKEALQYLERALPKQASNTSLLMAIAEAKMRSGKIFESITYYEKVLDQDPNMVAALFNLALLYNKIGNIDKARLYYHQAYIVQPQFIPIAFNYGNFLLREGNFIKAEEMYDKFLSQENLIADAHNNLGLAYIGLNRLNQALQHFQIALQIDPNNKMAEENFLKVKQEITNSPNK